MEKFYDAVNPGGTFIAIDHIIDDERRVNTMGLILALLNTGCAFSNRLRSAFS
ncbi:hypothetical protein [Haloarcula amylovorans]|uniref:hypothetical protein n=1 Tax=Haloarcula amylovorans TaxID=2562280 RepID=UPI0014306A13|nr:hypothetical protein [Halomicroarcula amylolytica]